MNAAPASDGGDGLGGTNDATAAMDVVRDRLLHCINSAGFWEGRLSSSALSTATASAP